MNRLLALSIVFAATAAQADVWQHAIDPSPGLDIYEALMTKGDEAAQAANAQMSSIQQVRKDIDTAVEAYRAAAKANPQSGEPFYRIGTVLNSFFLDCEDVSILTGNTPPRTCRDSKTTRDEMARQAVEAWDRFEALAPLDPRVNELLMTRAITRTKLVRGTADKALLEGAARDYKAVVDRKDGLSTVGDMSTVFGNLAETHMMLGKIDEAIATYYQAYKAGARPSTMYGLAVALDRDERSSDALSVIRLYGVKEYEAFKTQFAEGRVFFVPAGEEEYYFALSEEAFGNYEASITHWKRYIASGAHPQFQARARDHVGKLTTRKGLHLDVPLAHDLDFIPNPPTTRPKPPK